MIGPLARFAAAALLVASGATTGQGLSQASGAGLPPGAAVCRERLEQARDAADDNPRNLPRLGDVCAELAAAMSAGVWGKSLAAMEAKDLRPNEFTQLVGLAEHYERDTASGARLATDDLTAIVSGLRPFEPLPELSLWDRAMQWLQEWLGLENGKSDNRFFQWLRDFSIPEQWVRIVFYACGALIVVVALAVAFNELRHGNLFGRARRRRYSDDSSAADHAPVAGNVTLEDVQRAPMSRQPVLLLAMVLDRLRTRYSELFRDSMTHRELVVAATGLAAPQRTSFEAVVTSAERVTFAGWTPRAADVEPVLSHGRALLHDLFAEETATPPDAPS